MLQDIQRFAVKQIKTTAVSANRESGLFCSSRQNLNSLSSSSLSSNLTHPYLYSITRAARNTSIARSQNASLTSKTHERFKKKHTPFNWTKQCKFLKKSSFLSCVQHTNRKTNKQLIQLVSVRCSEGGGRKRTRD